MLIRVLMLISLLPVLAQKGCTGLEAGSLAIALMSAMWSSFIQWLFTVIAPVTA